MHLKMSSAKVAAILPGLICVKFIRRQTACQYPGCYGWKVVESSAVKFSGKRCFFSVRVWEAEMTFFLYLEITLNQLEIFLDNWIYLYISENTSNMIRYISKCVN